MKIPCNPVNLNMFLRYANGWLIKTVIWPKFIEGVTSTGEGRFAKLLGPWISTIIGSHDF